MTVASLFGVIVRLLERAFSRRAQIIERCTTEEDAAEVIPVMLLTFRV